MFSFQLFSMFSVAFHAKRKFKHYIVGTRLNKKSKDSEKGSETKRIRLLIFCLIFGGLKKRKEVRRCGTRTSTYPGSFPIVLNYLQL